VDTTTCAPYCLKASSEAYEDALDAIRFYAAKHPEWRTVLGSIQSYVSDLEASAGLHEPGL
jgi:hypothetical protein